MRLPGLGEGAAKSGSEHQASSPMAIPATWYDLSSRAVAQQAYYNDFVPTTGVPVGFTGNVSTGAAGDTSAAWKQAALNRVNYFRAMAGVPANITFDATLNAKAQQGALMEAANSNGSLNHQPPSSWRFYTAAGYDATSHGNLCYYGISSTVGGYPTDPGCVAQYMADQGESNSIVGHRRWILYSLQRQMGTGDVVTTANPSFDYVWNNLYILDQGTFLTSTPATRDGFIAWPPKGYVPYQIVPPRWSFSVPGNYNLSGAVVKVTKDGITTTQSLEQYVAGAGDNTVVFNPDGRGITNADPIAGPAPASDTVYTVSVEGVKLGAVTQAAYVYNVIVFNPAVTPGNGCSIGSTSTTAASGYQNITINVTGAGCGGWTASSPSNWAAVFPLSGTGAGTVNVTVYPNFGASQRNTTISIAGSPYTITQPSVGGTANERFVGQSYYYVLGRLASPSEITFQAQNGLKDGRAAFLYNLIFTPPVSDEFNQTSRYVAGLYVGLLNRDAEYGGWQFQRNALLQNQVDRLVLVRNFITSMEFQLKYPNQTDAEYVRMLYRQVLLREPSQAEVDFQVANLNGDRVGIASRFLISQEFSLGTGPRLLAFLYYATMLNRDPNAAELQTLIGMLTNAGATERLALINTILSSAEYQALLQ